MESKLEGLRNRNNIMTEKIDKMKEQRIKAKKEADIKELEMLSERVKQDKERKAKLRADKDKLFNEKDMVLMQQMQSQQQGLHKLIQEFRESNADKLIRENSELQDRLARLELEEREFKKDEDAGYYTMPVPGK